MRTTSHYHFSRGRHVGRAGPSATNGARASGEPVPRAPTVLVVDDQRDLADMAEMLLSANGMAVRVAYSAEEALATLRADPTIDAVFSDIAMPGMDGLQLAGIVETNYPHVKIILTSGYTDPLLLDTRRDSAMFITKPYNIGQVIDMLRG